jgi:CRP/FNR family transcriptional regulator, cyclic AMP receptor protein
MISQENYDSPWVKVNNANVATKLDRYKIGIPTIIGPNHTIYLQNEVSNNFYFLVKGRVKAFILEKDGTEKILSIHESGNFFGETATIDYLPRPCCTATMIKSEIILLTSSDLKKLMQIDSELCFNIFQSLAQKVRLLSCQVQDMAFLGAEQRVAQLLMRFANDFGTITPDGIKLSINFTDQDLAGLAGTCRVTVTKILNSFKKEGLIEKGYRTIIIKNQLGLLTYLYHHEENKTYNFQGKNN